MAYCGLVCLLDRKDPIGPFRLRDQPRAGIQSQLCETKSKRRYKPWSNSLSGKAQKKRSLLELANNRNAHAIPLAGTALSLSRWIKVQPTPALAGCVEVAASKAKAQKQKRPKIRTNRIVLNRLMPLTSRYHFVTFTLFSSQFS